MRFFATARPGAEPTQTDACPTARHPTVRRPRLATTALTALLALVGCFGTLGATPTSAAAADWRPCTFAIFSSDCASYVMPLDRSGALPGTTTVRVVRAAAAEGPRMGTLFVVAGGPGQTALAMVDLVYELFNGVNRYDIIAVDQRGAGTSEPLSCPRIESPDFSWNFDDPETDRLLGACSLSLGPARAAYNTAEAVADIETIRADLGIPTATFFGVSYGTKVALAYAKAHPAHTKALLLDSVLPTDMPDSFDLDAVAATRNALTEICAAGRCRGASSRTVADTARLVARLDQKPLVTWLSTTTGRTKKAEIDGAALWDIVATADFNPFIYSQLPGMLSESLSGRHAQLLRLFALVNGAVGADSSRVRARHTLRRHVATSRHHSAMQRSKAPVRAEEEEEDDIASFSATMNVATTCADFDPPWTRSDDTSGRQAVIDGGAAALPESALRPFNRRVLAARGTAAYCRAWQQSPTPPAVPQGPLAQIPTLALSGSLDLRTPPAWAERGVSGNPTAELVTIPGAGHSVIGTDLSGCALSLARRFLVYGGTDGKCARKAQPVPIAPRPVRSLGRVARLPGSCRKASRKQCTQLRRQLAAGELALRDVFDQLLIGGGESGLGLSGGWWALDYDLDAETGMLFESISLYGVSALPGVPVSGMIDLDTLPRVRASLRIGSMRVDISGRVARDRLGDRLTLSARRGRARVRGVVRARGGAARAASPSRTTLRLRRSYRLTTSGPSAQHRERAPRLLDR